MLRVLAAIALFIAAFSAYRGYGLVAGYEESVAFLEDAIAMSPDMPELAERKAALEAQVPAGWALMGSAVAILAGAALLLLGLGRQGGSLLVAAGVAPSVVAGT